jgi:hypothetical protein
MDKDSRRRLILTSFSDLMKMNQIYIHRASISQLAKILMTRLKDFTIVSKTSKRKEKKKERS